MRRLPLPAILVEEVLSTCIRGVRDAALGARLSAIEPALVAKATSYDRNARAQSLDLIPQVQTVGAVTAAELRGLYSTQMSARGGAARPFYDAIRGPFADAKCPLCGVGGVAVLDHHLPQSKYPDLCLCPWNLVPACHFCNDAKRAKYPKTASEQTIHPYYEDFNHAQWIYARLVKGRPPVLQYFVSPPSSWPQVDRERVEHHFNVIKLRLLFTLNATDELIILRDHLATIKPMGGAAGIQAYLDDEKCKYAKRINSWQHVMYQTLAADAWFVHGGHRMIGQ